MGAVSGFGLLAFGILTASIVLFVVVFVLFGQSRPPRKDPAMLAELSELREENARLREENEQLRKRPDTGSTGIKET